MRFSVLLSTFPTPATARTLVYAGDHVRFQLDTPASPFGYLLMLFFYLVAWLGENFDNILKISWKSEACYPYIRQISVSDLHLLQAISPVVRTGRLEGQEFEDRGG